MKVNKNGLLGELIDAGWATRTPYSSESIDFWNMFGWQCSRPMPGETAYYHRRSMAFCGIPQHAWPRDERIPEYWADLGLPEPGK